MREIKFRAWDKKNKIMCQVWDIGWKAWREGSPINYVRVWNTKSDGTYELLEHECILLQYTGCKDKNGKEIYEGDILEGTTYKEPIVQKTAKRCIGMVKIIPDKLWVKWQLPKNFGTYPYLSDRDIEIIGNIYENPELLEGTNG